MTRPSRSDRERGSAMVMALFVLFLLASTGTALLFLTDHEVKMSQANLRSSAAFYIAESAVEAGRQRLYDLNGLADFDDDLLAAAGDDGAISIDPDAIQPVFDSSGTLTGVTGAGDDVPLVTLQTVSDGAIVAYLMNDPLESPNGRTTLTDDNDRLAVIGIGAGRDRSFEVVEAIIERRPPIPLQPPATITLLGQPPEFYSANSKVKEYVGEDCDGAGVAGLNVPIVGAIGGAAETQAEAGIEDNPDFTSGSYVDEETFSDLTNDGDPLVADGLGTIDTAWNDCANLHAILDDLRDRADYVCRSNICTFPDYGPDTLIFIDNDYNLGPTQSGEGILVCTGELTMSGRTSWTGLILVVGEGVYRLNGSGNGEIIGGMLLADIAGADGVYGTSDDCETGTPDVAVFDERGGGNALTNYCSTVLQSTNVRPYEVVEFLQH